MKTVAITFRINDVFESKPYNIFRKIYGKWSIDWYFGWLWFRFNVEIYDAKKRFGDE